MQQCIELGEIRFLWRSQIDQFIGILVAEPVVRLDPATGDPVSVDCPIAIELERSRPYPWMLFSASHSGTRSVTYRISTSTLRASSMRSIWIP